MSKPIDREGRAFQKALDELHNAEHLPADEVFELGWDAAVEWTKQKQKEEGE